MATASARLQRIQRQPQVVRRQGIANHVIELFPNGDVDRVELVYTRFITPGNQEVVLRPLVPLSAEAVAGGDGKAGLGEPVGDYEFEPDPSTILERSCRATSRPVATPAC